LPLLSLTIQTMVALLAPTFHHTRSTGKLLCGGGRRKGGQTDPDAEHNPMHQKITRSAN
jgi:hypothetical protein